MTKFLNDHIAWMVFIIFLIVIWNTYKTSRLREHITRVDRKIEEATQEESEE